MARITAFFLISIASLIVNSRLFRWLSAYREAEMWDLFSGDVSESSPVSAGIRWWCKVLKAAR